MCFRWTGTDAAVRRRASVGAATYTFGELVSRLPGCNVTSDSRVHLDPDLRRDMHSPSNAPWRPMFGQCDSAERHLEKQEVDRNDLFLFFGWFRRIGHDLSFERSAHDEHVLWGWLQVDHYFDPLEVEPEWAKRHPHCLNKRRKWNRVYVGRKSLSFAPSKPGAGTFAAYHPDLRLTHPDYARRRSQWRIPSFFWEKLSYHRQAAWIPEGQHCSISSAKIGQEFVFDTEEHESAVQKWLHKLFSHVPGGTSY